tara:strand:- start:5796 stop:7940 length:2145 start_codon:yes stop_codon:yes gene_type:complete
LLLLGVVKFLLINVILFVTVFGAQSQSVYKSFAHLDRKDLYTAHKGFVKRLNRSRAEASLGLSLCYSERSFLNIDSSLKYLLIAEENWPSISIKSKLKLKAFDVDSIFISDQKLKLGDLFFGRCKLNKDPDCFESMIATQAWNSNIDQGIYYRDSLYFERAKKNQSTEDIKKLLSTHPESLFKAKLNALHDSYELNNSISGNTEEEWVAFIDAHPENRYAGPLQDSVYRFFDKKDVVLYISFIEKYPKNRNVEIAWQRIYELETNYFHPELLNSFSATYSDFPFKEQLENDLIRSAQKLYPFTDTTKGKELYYGYTHENGGWVIQPQSRYREATFFNQDLAVVGSDGYYGVINKKEQFIIPIKYDEISILNNGLILAGIEDVYGLFNRDGSIHTSLAWDDIVEVDSVLYLLYKDDVATIHSIHSKGHLGIAVSDMVSLKNGYYKVVHKDLCGLVKIEDEKTGAIELVYPFEWGEIKPYSDRFISVQLRDTFRLFDLKTNALLDSVYINISQLSQGAAVALKETGVGYLNGFGEEQTDFNYDFFPNALSSGAYKGGQAIVRLNNKYGLIDLNGVSKLSPQYEHLVYLDSLYGIRSGEEWSLISIDGELAIQDSFESLDDLGQGLTLFKSKSKYGVFEKGVNLLLPAVYTSIELFQDYFVVQSAADTFAYILDKQGKLASTIGFDKVKSLNKDCLMVDKDGGRSYFRLSDGKLIHL